MDKSMENKLCELGEMKDTFTSWLKAHMDEGVHNVSIKEAGEAADIIKDFAEAQMLCYQAEYYKHIIEAMENDDSDRLGYNRAHLNNGRFATKGNGHVVYGYRPMVDEEPYVDAYMHDPNFDKNMRLGYTEPTIAYHNRPIMGSSNQRYSQAYNNYRDAKRHYTQTKSPTDKAEMDTFTNEHLADTIATLREMWTDADPNLRKRMKADLTSLVNEMAI